MAKKLSPLATPLLEMIDLHVSVEGKEIVRGLSLTVHPGEIHAIMGPNGSGKSTLVSAVMGHPKYVVDSGKVRFHGKDLLALEPHERAQKGLFLAFQYPKEIAGVTLRSFLYAAAQTQTLSRNPKAKRLSPLLFKKTLEDHMKRLHMDPAFADRSLNQGFSGGEKKKAEILQMSILHPSIALLDETDSGLDVDALKIVAGGVNALRDEAFSAIIVTHYARILETVKPDHVHVMIKGKIVKSGGPELALQLEKDGYRDFLQEKKISLE